MLVETQSRIVGFEEIQENVLWTEKVWFTLLYMSL